MKRLAVNWESKPRTPLASAASALPLSHDMYSQTTTSHYNPLYVLHRWYILDVSVAHLATTHYVPSELCWGATGKFSPSGKNPCSVVFSLEMLRASCLILEIKECQSDFTRPLALILCYV